MIQDVSVTQKKTPPTMTHDQVDLIKRTICKGADDDELKLFLSVCEKKKLDPFTNQIYAVKRWSSQLRRYVMNFQTSIDGFRLIAERTGKYAGQKGPFFCGEDGEWNDLWLKPGNPFAAKIAVLRNDFSEPLWQVARFSSFVQVGKDGKPNQFWSKMPDHQIGKVAEALAIRRAFPSETSGLFIPEEMPAEDKLRPEDYAIEPLEVTETYAATDPHKKILIEVAKGMGIEDMGMVAGISRELAGEGVDCTKEAIATWIKLNVKDLAEG